MPHYILKGSKVTKEVDIFKFGHILNQILSDNFDILPSTVVKKINKLADQMNTTVQSKVLGIRTVVQHLKEILKDLN